MNSLRLFILICIITLLLPVGFAIAAPSPARIDLENTINSVLTELKKPGLRDAGQRGVILGNVERIITGLFDFNELSARTVGASWKDFSVEQKQRFTDNFTTLLRETYLEKLNGYNGEHVSYVGETASNTGEKVEIQTTISVKGKPASVAYRMLKKQRWVVYDVIIEGVSMVQNYRTQFQELLVKGDVEALITLVKTKANAMREFNKKQQMS